ncbi:MAG TPA: hypothetical protein VG325_18165 [Solirubrobacteraceae bacterium]|jgi:hypothetical protein|nr:hypothetical protein [Solirubrobacteraceae bacterium]
MSQPAGRRATLGTVIDDRYLVRRKLGVGATAVVYCAEDRVLARAVSAMTLRMGFGDSR